MTGSGRDRSDAGSRSEAAAFYDDLASAYDRLYPDWEAAIRHQAGVIGRLVSDRLGSGAQHILDCAAGVGTQTLGLLSEGHRVIASDVSAQALARLRQEGGQRGRQSAVVLADMRRMPFAAGGFDAVVCLDNAVAHLPSSVELIRALAEMGRVLRPGGLMMVSTRDYSAVRRDRPPGTLPQVSGEAGHRSVAFQVWDWEARGRRYRLTHFVLSEQARDWTVRVRHATLSAFTAQDLVAATEAAGLHSVEWLPPEETGFLQPMLLARTPGEPRHER